MTPEAHWLDQAALLRTCLITDVKLTQADIEKSFREYLELNSNCEC